MRENDLIFFLGSTVDSRFKGFKLAKKSGPVEGQCSFTSQ